MNDRVEISEGETRGAAELEELLVPYVQDRLGRRRSRSCRGACGARFRLRTPAAVRGRSWPASFARRFQPRPIPTSARCALGSSALESPVGSHVCSRGAARLRRKVSAGRSPRRLP